MTDPIALTFSALALQSPLSFLRRHQLCTSEL